MPRNKSCPPEFSHGCGTSPSCPPISEIDIEALASIGEQEKINDVISFLPILRTLEQGLIDEYEFDASKIEMLKALQTCSYYRSQFIERLQAWQKGTGELHPIGPDIIGSK